MFLIKIVLVLVFLYIIVVIVLVRCYKNTNKQLLKRLNFFFSVKTEPVFFTMLTKFRKLSQQYSNIIQYNIIRFVLCSLRTDWRPNLLNDAILPRGNIKLVWSSKTIRKYSGPFVITVIHGAVFSILSSVLSSGLAGGDRYDGLLYLSI